MYIYIFVLWYAIWYDMILYVFMFYLGWVRCLRFNNMFYMKVIELSSTLGQELPYIVGLQTELPFGKRDLAQLAKNTKAGRARSKKISDISIGSIYSSGVDWIFPFLWLLFWFKPQIDCGEMRSGWITMTMNQSPQVGEKCHPTWLWNEKHICKGMIFHCQYCIWNVFHSPTNTHSQINSGFSCTPCLMTGGIFLYIVGELEWNIDLCQLDIHLCQFHQIALLL